MESSVLLKGFPTVNSASGTFLTPPPPLGGRPLLEALVEESIFQGVSITPLLRVWVDEEILATSLHWY